MLTPQEQQEAPQGDFTDTRVIFVAGNNENAHLYVSPDSVKAYFFQHCDGPIYLVIAPNADTESLARMSARFDIPIETMQAFCKSQQTV
jgi:hypothetical protein